MVGKRREFINHSATLHDGNRAALVILEGNVIRVDAQVTVQRGEEVSATDNPVRRIFAARIGCAHHLTRREATAREEH